MTERRPRFLLPRRSPPGQPVVPVEPPEVSMEARPEDVAAPVEESMVDAGLYVGGKRVGSPTTIADAAAQLRSTPNGLLWIGLFRPTEAQFRPVAEDFALHELAVEDAIVAHQRPKIERY